MTVPARSPTPTTLSIEPRTIFRLPGILALLGQLLFAGAIGAGFLVGAGMAEQAPMVGLPILGGALLGGPLWLFLWRGFLVLEPNQAAVAMFFGSYSGTLQRDGYHFINPLLSTRKVSLRLQTFETPHLKVNEKGGRPIEIGAVVTWSVTEPETALLAIEDYMTYIRQRTEVGLREVAAAHPYEAEEGKDCLRGNQSNVSAELKSRVAPLAKVAGITIEDINITQLAYAPEIAGIMLVKQQAESLLSARKVIVEGAVRIAADAIKQLEAEGLGIPDAERGRVLSNLLTVLASERGTTPVVSVGG